MLATAGPAFTSGCADISPLPWGMLFQEEGGAMRWGTEEPRGPLPNLQPTPTPGLSSQEITCVLAARSGLSWICCCCLQGKASHNASLPSSPRSIRVSHKYHRHGPPAGSLTHHFSTFPATKTWELDFSPGSQPFLCGDYFFFP